MAKQEKEKQPKKKKIKKAPGFYKKTLSPEALEKKYLKYIEVPVDKTFVSSCYEQREDGLHIRTDLDADQVKHLKVLAKAIKKNRQGAVNFIPLVAVAVLVAAVVVFFAVFANPLLQKAMETGLETVFEARVNADHFRISLFKFEIAMNGLTIADRDHPMKNLIQFSTMRIKLKPAAVMRGKIYIEELRADSIRFGTDRTVSGALPDKPPKPEKPQEETSFPALVDLKNFDAMALLNQEYDKLQTPKLYDQAKDAYDTAVTKWKGEQEAAIARIAELQSKAAPLLKINVNDYKTLDVNTVEQIKTTITQVNDLVNTVQAAQGDVNRMVSGAQADINTAVSLEQSARNAFTADYNHLRSYLDLGSGAAQEVIEPIVRSVLTDTSATYLGYGERALEILDKVKALQAKLPASSASTPAPRPVKKEKFRGRDVIFPVKQYPRFFLGVLATDVLTPSNWHWGFDLRGVSSDPDLSGVPTSLALSLAETGDGTNRSGAFSGTADFRSNAKERFNAQLSGGGFPVAVSLNQAGIGGFSGGASFKVNTSGDTSRGFTAGGSISLIQAKLTNPTNTFTQAASDAIGQVKSVDLGVAYQHVVSGKDSFSLTTNFTDILKDALSRIVSQYRKQAEDALEKALRSKIDQYIDGKFISKDDLDTVFKAIRGDKSAVDDLKNTLDKKKTDLENKVKSAAQDAVKQAADEAKQQVQQQGQQAVQDVLQGKTPSVTAPAPSLPSVPAIPNLLKK